MPKEVIMPALGMAQDEGVLLRWLKKEGEMVTGRRAADGGGHR